ncbi:hypothetical protein ACFQI7_18450 [Paenibacillus allorhizosphaerae]|uniref:Uncharacterized protein n=1 Tax=Paenibacillus allorhizosphaerae TaxID=2849866 RepID=A0ABM8VF52_9BACL|nr:hypothetical protein [Paenibacillus allorhizosphaerae]CAG7633683.1 hypothetical protein PAECIP111802_01972 [Paenibacillus allorhizosphaerae]
MNIRRHIVTCFILLLLMYSTAHPGSVQADSGDAPSPAEDTTEAQVIRPIVLGKADIGEASSMELKDVMLLPGDNDGTVSFTLAVNNGGPGDLDFMNYWIRLQSAAGNPFTVNLLPQVKDKNRIPAYTSQEFHFYAKVNRTTKLQDLVFTLIQLDFSVAGFEKVIGRITAPDSYSFVTPAGKEGSLDIGDIPFIGKIARAAVSRNDDYYLPSLYFEMTDVGTKGTKLPDLAYFIRTKQGQTYPLQSTVFTKDADIQPLDKKEGLLTGSIPREAGADGWQLVIAQPAGGNGIGESVMLPVAFFEVPAAVAADVSIGNDYDFASKSGTYTARLTSLQRLPWDDQDILAATMTLTNNGSEPLPVPNLQGYFKLDDTVTIEAQFIRNDRVISLLPGKEISVQIAGKIPYTGEFQSIQLYLQEKEADNKVKDLLTFHHNRELMNMTVIPANGTRTLTDIGYSAAYTIRAVHTFQGNNTDLFAVQMDVENLEKRSADLRRQVAQFQAADGTVFPASITEVGKINPRGKALQSVWTTLPKDFDTEGIQLIIGDEVSVLPPSGSGSNEGARLEGYVNAVSFQLPAERKEPKAGFADLEIYPYSITLSHIGTQMDFTTGKVQLSFDYELNKNALVEADMKDHKLIVELKDELFESGKEIVISETYDLNGTDASKSLQLGSHDAAISYTNKDKIYNIKDMKSYQLNVYHQFQNGQKKLLATKELEWFIYAD